MGRSGDSERWGIVGGGFLGMTLAYRLAKEGRDVTLFEGADQLGGLASPWNLGGVVWDRHYHVILLSDSYLRSLLSLLGLEKELKWVETRTGFYTDGKLYSMSNTLEFFRFPPLGLIGKVRLGATIFYASKIRDWKSLEKILVSDWLIKWSGNHTFEKIWLPLLRAKLGENYKKASAAFIWSTIQRMYAARRTGLKKEMFGYIPGGYARIIDSFSRALCYEKVTIKLRHVVRNVQGIASGGVSVECENGYRDAFDQVALTMASPIAAAICPELSEDEQERHIGIQYQGIICASLLLKKPLKNFYVTNITEDWVPFTAVIEMTALVDNREFGGNTLVYLPKYVPPGDPAFVLSDSEVEEMFIDALLKMYPHISRGDLLSFRISRVPFVLAIPTLNYSEFLPPMETSIPGVRIINSAHILNGTLNVNETLQLAGQAADRLLNNRSS